MNALTNERLNTIASWRKTYGDAHNVMIPAHEAEELVSRLLVAEARVVELEQRCEIDPRTHQLIDMKERVAELEAQLAELRGQNNLGYASRKAVVRMLDGRTRFTCVYPEPTGDYKIPVYLDPVPPAASHLMDHRAEGIIFTANRLLAAWDAGFIDKPASDTLDVATMILSAIDALPDATDGDFKRDFADEMLTFLREEAKKEPASQPYTVPDEMVGSLCDQTDIQDYMEAGKVIGWNACRAAMLQSGNTQKTNGSREHFISLCNEFWNWQEFDEINAGEEEPCLEWDGEKFTHRVTQTLWRIYQAAPGNCSATPVRYMNRFTGVCLTLEQQPDAATDADVYIPLVPLRKGE
ncbi:hypothetical protein [Symbiopectobacterium purcellii]|uniref:hypothetical protein n=1 Tax=Symbiopectobacterium purcellii TaxID=2871826 RepID=UPI0020769D14|nr:hypothetical protein [Symbiopectobacterium purcellii]